MRHRVYGKHLGRNKNQRTALFKNLVRSLLISGAIETTEAKAKAIKGLVDKIITQAKSTTTQRLISQFLTDKTVVEKLIKDITPRLSDRVSGYTSTVRLGKRQGDGGMMVRMSLLTKESQESRVKSQEKKVEDSLPKVQDDNKPEVKTVKRTKKGDK